MPPLIAFALDDGPFPRWERAFVVGAGLAMFAVACPVCNKIVLLALGTSGALGFWQPLQPFLAAISLAALIAAVAWAWRRNPCADNGCDAGCSVR